MEIIEGGNIVLVKAPFGAKPLLRIIRLAACCDAIYFNAMADIDQSQLHIFHHPPTGLLPPISVRGNDISKSSNIY